MISFFRATFLRHAPQRFAVMQPQHADRKYNDYTGALTDAQIAAHLAGRTTYAVPTAEHGLACYLPLDIDAGGSAAIHTLMQAAAQRGLWSFGQYHAERERGYVWVPFDDLTNAERIRRLGDELIGQVQRPGWKIENRATNEDTRLPLARHQWTGTYGKLLIDGICISIDADPTGAAAQLAAAYRANLTSQLPPAPEAAPRKPQGNYSNYRNYCNIDIRTYNAATDLVSLLEHCGAKQARGQGRRLYFCPFHGDDHASLLVSADGTQCRCMSAGSDCALTGHQHDAFNVFCIGERLTPTQALRRLNGHPDDPPRGPQTPPAAPGGPAPRTTQPASHNAAQRPAAPDPAPFAPSQQINVSSTARLPKTCRRILDLFAQARGQYWRGVAQLAQALEVDTRTVQRNLRRLEAAQLIERQQRGRDGHTDIYRLRGGVAKRVSARAEAAPAPTPAPEGGRHLPPTIEHENHDHTESLAERGGNQAAAHGGQVAPAADADGAQQGPGGAVAFVGGAAYVPPQAATWYSNLVQLAQPAADSAPEQIALVPSEAVPEIAPEPQRPAKRRAKRQRARARETNPATLAGQITAATRKAEKVARSNPKQARALRRQAEHLQARLAVLRAKLEAEHDAAALQMLAMSMPPSSTSSSAHGCPPSSLPPVDYAATASGLVARLHQRCTALRGSVSDTSASGGDPEAVPQAD